MQAFIISLVALIASLLTFFSGFGPGTILTPVFIIFFPVEIAIALTGIVHPLTNFFKIALIGRQINWKVGVRFGVTAIIGAFIGAELMLLFSNIKPFYTYIISDRLFSITMIKLIISILMIVFSLFEIIPSLKNIQFEKINYMLEDL